MTENKALITIQPTYLAQVGKSDGAIDKLAQLARGLLGENFQPTMPATEGDAAVITFSRTGAPNSLRLIAPN